MVLPSLFEAMGKVIVEAGLYGLPTIASDVGGVPENVVHEQTGLLIPPGNALVLKTAIARCLTDAKLARLLGQQAREQCHRP